MKFLRIEKIKTSQIILLIVLIILVFPSILALPAISKYFDFTNTGEIGDTIGGITAPFINGLAAILVFIAFKAQIKANEIFKNQEKAKNILDQIKIIQDDKVKIERVIAAIKDRPEALRQPAGLITINLINKVAYFASEIRLAYELIEEYNGEKDFLYRKLYYLYVIRYKYFISGLVNVLKKELPKLHNDYVLYITELLYEFQHFEDELNNVNKYKK